METRARESEPGVFVVLGATGGVGSALTRRLAGQGHRVLAAGRSAERLEALASETGAKPFVLDARRTGEVLACLSAAMDHFGELDGVANCVGSLLLKPATSPRKRSSLPRSRRTSARRSRRSTRPPGS